jgi:hypothetical protein
MGERLANLEMCMFLLHVIKEFKLTNSAKSSNVQMNAQVSLRTDQDLYLELQER